MKLFVLEQEMNTPDS